MRPEKHCVLLLILTLLSCMIVSDTAKVSAGDKHRFKQLTSRRARSVAECSTVDPLFQYDLPAILKPRVPGTSSHKEVKDISRDTIAGQAYLPKNAVTLVGDITVKGYGISSESLQYIYSRLQQLGPRWEMTVDTFSTDTPLGEMSFTNLVATLDPHVDRRLVLAAHYDSKIIGGSKTKFLGATDSALPCALLLDLAHSLNSKLQTRKLQDFSLQLIFFDGEEAFVRWTNTDSIYGSRHLASQMAQENGLLSIGNKTGLQAMEAFVLLDLIGAKSPKFPNFFDETSNLYEQFMNIEERLDKIKQLEDYSKPGYFPTKRLVHSGIQDDHIPFHRRGVPILHLIVTPFPSVWHTVYDNFQALDKPTISNLRKIFVVFLHEYFALK